MLGLRCYMGISLDIESGDYSPAMVHGLFIAVTSLVAEHGLSAV